ncbi:MAG: bifunctional pyr operon transcriptional regulator/uracil phosphoribosyltransferase PyrR [bacterium]
MNTNKNESLLMDKKDINRALQRIADEILEENKSVKDLVMVGIRSKGEHLAKRLCKIINKAENIEIPLGIIDTTLYRDDLNKTSHHPVIKKTEISFSVTDKKVVLVDDVLYTGRTIRAAMDALIDLGRPKCIQLVVLIDRGHRELPIHADYKGKYIPTPKNKSIRVMLSEEKEEEGVFLIDGPEKVEW